MPDDVRELLSLDALDERIAIVGTSGSGKTYAAKGFSSGCSITGRGWRSSIRSGFGGACGRAPTLPRLAIPWWCSADDTPTCRSTKALGAALGRLPSSTRRGWQFGMTYIAGHDRSHWCCFCRRQWMITVRTTRWRFIDAFVDGLDLAAAGFGRVEPKATGRPAYAPSELRRQPSMISRLTA
jgi:hypothetical protein